MKFSQLEYCRPNYEETFQEFRQLTELFKKAQSAQEQLELFKEFEALLSSLNTQVSLCAIRNTIDTRDAFFMEEQDYHDQQAPLLEEKVQEFHKALVGTAFRPQLEEALGKLLFQNIELALRAFSPEIIPLMQEENRLATEYQKLYASAQIPFEGKTLTIAQLGPYKESTDRTLRRKALEAEGSFFDMHREEFDLLFDQLVKNRTQQAKQLGFESYVELAALRRLRNCYTPKEVAWFRDQVVQDLVPLTKKIKACQAQRIDIEDFKFWDNALKFRDGSATPQGTPEEILAAGKRMYQELSSETREFIELMFENELFDVLAKEGKAPGGYCASLEDYGYPFIFSNFNGTSGDVDVLTHEAGHAFADYIANKTVAIHALRCPTMDAAETHSTSMEFLTAPWHSLFFGEQTEKYELSHLEDALVFIPYGCLVDHFQEEVYRHPEMTPSQRNETWLQLEHRYRPYLDFGDLPFYSRGAGWQRQLHIYLNPFYYIDYCLAHIAALQFFRLSLKNREVAWEKYMEFVKLGGTKTFLELLHTVGLLSPLDEGCVKEVCRSAVQWLKENGDESL